MTPEQREKERIKFARRWADPEQRAKIKARSRPSTRKRKPALPASPAQLARKAAEQRKYRKDPLLRLRHAARSAVRIAIAAGKLLKGACSVCGITEHIEAHHDDYARPLDVRWLCRPHHIQHHHGH